jgi:hypothetical protein
MRKSQRNIAGAIALGVTSLWASGYAYAQGSTAPPSGQPARHIAAGAPRTFLFQIGFRL